MSGWTWPRWAPRSHTWDNKFPLLREEEWNKLKNKKFDTQIWKLGENYKVDANSCL